MFKYLKFLKFKYFRLRFSELPEVQVLQVSSFSRKLSISSWKLVNFPPLFSDNCPWGWCDLWSPKRGETNRGCGSGHWDTHHGPGGHNVEHEPASGFGARGSCAKWTHSVEPGVFMKTSCKKRVLLMFQIYINIRPTLKLPWVRRCRRRFWSPVVISITCLRMR